HRRVARLIDPELAQRLEAATATLSSAIHDATPGRIDVLDDELTTYLTALRDAASRARSAIDTAASDPKAASARAEAVTALSDISDTATRILSSFVPAISDRTDVVWLDHEDNRGSIRAVVRVAPLSVAGLLRGRLFEHTTAVLTSATLTIGGTFEAMASAWGLAGEDDVKWRGLDVGSPFEHAKSGILYVAAHLPPPGRDGTGSAEQLDEIAALITAAGGRWGCSRRCAQPRPPPRSCASGSTPRCCARARTPRRRWCSGSPMTPRPRCSARCRCGRAWTCPGRRCHWYSSTAYRSPGPTTRC